MKRRNFILQSSAALSLPFIPKFALTFKDNIEQLLENNLPINFTRDGLDLSPKLYALLLEQLVQEKGFETDSYGHGGIIDEFERKIAKALGKEAAVYLPTGTLANHLALRNHCVLKKRAIVQYHSHINRDSGDCMSNISGINLLTLGQDQTIFGKDTLLDILQDSTTGKVSTPIGAISIETPIRRKHLRRVPFSKIEEIVGIAKKHKIATHLDGARLFIDAAFSGKKVTDYTTLFDTIYLSLYKSFNSIGGAILVGSKAFIEDLHHQRRMFGGTLPSSWQQIVIADYFFDNYTERYDKALVSFDSFKEKLIQSGKFQFDVLELGSNIVKLMPTTNIDVYKFKNVLAKSNINIPDWNSKDNCFYFKINDSLLYNDMDEVADSFIDFV